MINWPLGGAFSKNFFYVSFLVIVFLESKKIRKACTCSKNSFHVHNVKYSGKIMFKFLQSFVSFFLNLFLLWDCAYLTVSLESVESTNIELNAIHSKILENPEQSFEKSRFQKTVLMWLRTFNLSIHIFRAKIQKLTYSQERSKFH